MLSIWTSLKIYLLVKVKLQQKLEPDQVGSTCRQQNKSVNDEIFIIMVRKNCEKRRKCWLPAYFSFPTMFSKGLTCISHGYKHRIV